VVEAEEQSANADDVVVVEHVSPYSGDKDAAANTNTNLAEQASSKKHKSFADLDPSEWPSHFGRADGVVTSIHADVDVAPAESRAHAHAEPSHAKATAKAPTPAPSSTLPTLMLDTHQTHATNARALKSTPNDAADLVRTVQEQLAKTRHLSEALERLKQQQRDFEDHPAEQLSKAKSELDALQRGEAVYTTTRTLPPVELSPSARSTPQDLLASLRSLKEPDSATPHATDANFPSFESLGLLETDVSAQRRAHQDEHQDQQHRAYAHMSKAQLQAEAAPTPLSLPGFPDVQEFLLTHASAPAATQPHHHAQQQSATHVAPAKHHPQHRPSASDAYRNARLLDDDTRFGAGSSLLEIGSATRSTLAESDSSARANNFDAVLARQERVLDQLSNKYSQSDYAHTVRDVLGDEIPDVRAHRRAAAAEASVVSGGGGAASQEFVFKQRIPTTHHPRVVESISNDLDKNADNAYRAVMAAAHGEDSDALSSLVHDLHTSATRFVQKRKSDSSVDDGAVVLSNVLPTVPASSYADTDVFPELDVPSLHLKTVKTPAEALSRLIRLQNEVS